MTLPIVIGGKSISAQTLPGPRGRHDATDDGTLLNPDVLHQSLGWGVCPQKEWLVRVTCNYYDLINSATLERDCTMAEVAIQISPLARPLSWDYRETSHHLKLYDCGTKPTKTVTGEDGKESDHSRPMPREPTQPQVVVSTDRRNLALLLYHPHEDSTALVIFQLRKPREDLLASATRNPIPLPSYIQKVGNEDSKAIELTFRDPPAIASHPRFVSVWGIEAVSCLPPTVNPSVFLAVCQDGSLVWLDARSSMAVATGYLDLSASQKQQWLPFTTMRIAPTSEMNNGQVLLLSKNGNAMFVHWNLDAKSKVQQTFLKRASTGSVVVDHQTMPPLKQEEAAPTPNRNKSSDMLDMFSNSSRGLLNRKPSINRRKEPPGRSKSSELVDMLSPRVRKVFRLNTRSPEVKKKALDEETKKGFDSFALKQLQKRTLSAVPRTAPPSEASSISSESGPSPLLQDVKAQEAQRKLKERQQRRKSETITEADTLKRQMKMQILTKLSDGGIVDAQFASVPTVVCFQYEPDVLTRRVAEVFTLSRDGTFQPLLELSLSKEQVQESFLIHTGREFQSSASLSVSTDILAPQSRQGMDHDAVSDTFAISTLYGGEKKWIGCLWNWRSNALSWTVQQTSKSDFCWQRLYFARHPHYSQHVAILQCCRDKCFHVRKEIAATGLLSPPSYEGEYHLEPNSMLLTSDSVRFPEAHKQAGSDTLELDWRVSALPLNYRNSYGPPKIAACGRQHGNSIAVASSRGVCILDKHFKWRQFGTPSEERSFQVIAMTWWEGMSDHSLPEELSEDLLLAIVQSDNGRQYLSCWSPKRLDLAHQLLETLYYEPTTNDDGSACISWGISLVRDVRATSVSLLTEPHSKTRRAVVLVSSLNPGSGDLEYSCYRLQVLKPGTKASTAESYQDLRPYSVVFDETIHGATLNVGTCVAGPISSVFLAGACFNFDITTTNNEKKSKAEEEITATVGIVRSTGGIAAAALSNIDRKVYLSAVLEEGAICKICHCDTLRADQSNPSSTSSCLRPMDAFVWTIELLNGQTYTWAVPYVPFGQKSSGMRMPHFYEKQNIQRPSGLRPPCLVSKGENDEGLQRRYQLGILCHVGRSSDWMQQASSGTQSDVPLGMVPNSKFGCFLRSGQHARTIHRSGVVGDFDSDLFASDFLESEVYGPGDFLMMPPTFVLSIYMLLLEAAHLRLERPIMEESKSEAMSDYLEEGDAMLESIGAHIDFRLAQCPNKDATMMALRLLILRSVEMLSHVDKKHRKTQSDVSRSNLMLALALFTEIVELVRRCTSNLQYASLFLEVGRQIEPSLLAHLFPLPLAHSRIKGFVHSPRRKSNIFVPEKDALDRFNARTVVELFSLCIHEGSLPASASALPLLSSRMLSQNYIDLLLERAIDVFVKNVDSTESGFDRSREERDVIGDIFRFGVKMEDAVKFEEKMLSDESKPDETSQSLSQDKLSESARQMSVNGYYSTDDDDSEYFVRSAPQRSLICAGGNNREGKILDMIGCMFDGGSKKSEDEIRRAASSFIGSKKNYASLDFLKYGANESDDDGAAEGDDSISLSVDELKEDPSNHRLKSPRRIQESVREAKSVALVVGQVLHDMLKTPKIDTPWKAIASLSHLILKQAKEISPLEVYQTAARRVSKEDLEAVLPVGYDDDNSGRLASFLPAEIGRCEFQLHSPAQHTKWIVDLVLLLLTRLGPEHSEVEASLVLIGLIAGDRSGLAESLLDSLEDSNHILVCYKYMHQNESSWEQRIQETP